MDTLVISTDGAVLQRQQTVGLDTPFYVHMIKCAFFQINSAILTGGKRNSARFQVAGQWPGPLADPHEPRFPVQIVERLVSDCAILGAGKSQPLFLTLTKRLVQSEYHLQPQDFPLSLCVQITSLTQFIKIRFAEHQP